MRGVALAIGLAFTGCGGDEDGGDTDSTTPTDSETDTGGDPTGGTTTPQALSVTLRDPAGAGMGGINVNFCNAAGCRSGPTAADGSISFDNVELVPYALEPIAAEGSGLATPLVPLTFAADEVKAFDLVVPPLGPASPLGSTSEEEFQGLFVTVGAAGIQEPAFHEPATEIAGVLADPAAWPPINLPGTVLAVWYLAPFNYAAPAGLPTRITNSYGLADGATAHVYVGSYDDFAWLDGGTVTAGGGFLTGASLPLLSTVVLIQE